MKGQIGRVSSWWSSPDSQDSFAFVVPHTVGMVDAEMISNCMFSSFIFLLAFGLGCGESRITPPPPPPPLNISTISLPDWMATFPYNQTLQASGGVAPLTWHVSSGSLPHGLSLGNSASNSVTISGTPDVVETATFAIQVTDSKNQTATQSYSIEIKNLISVQLLPIQGQVAADTIEIQGLSAGPFNPVEWQQVGRRRYSQRSCLQSHHV